MILLAALVMVGCGQATNDVSQLDQETINQEEVQKTEETKEEKDGEEEAEEEASQTEASSSQDLESAGEQLDAQPEDVQKENMAGQSEPDQVSSLSQVESIYESEEDLAYDGDLGDPDLYPNQPMFIDGVLHSGDTSGITADMIITAEDLRSGGYTVYELSDEDYDRLMQDINNSVISYEEALSHYLSNY